ncbi:protein kinase [Hamiltosporidium tvaerminnensis]|nr:protein kinase [Hamiltosporidium tvaerminnensis]
MEAEDFFKSNYNSSIRTIVYTKKGVRKISTYKFVETVGSGTFGIVMRVKKMNSYENLALKRVYIDSRYYQRELEILKKINHKNLLNLIEYFYSNVNKEGRFLNMLFQYSQNTLYDLIKVEDETEKIIFLYKQALDGLEYLHSLNICHRDIKPLNILVDSDGILKICDFGSAKVLENGTKNITYICSRHYRAPENLLGISSYDCKIDVWAMGCVFCEFYTRCPLFKGENNTDQLSKITEVVYISYSDALEMNLTYDETFTPIGIKNYLRKISVDTKLVDVIEMSLVFNPNKRASSTYLAQLPIFKNYKTK